MPSSGPGDLVEETGAVIMGRRSYDNSIEAWGGKGPLADVPCFVVTHKPPASSDPVFTFVTDGIERALAKAQEVAAEKRIGLSRSRTTTVVPVPGDHSLREYVEAVAAAVGAWLPGVVAQAAPAAT